MALATKARQAVGGPARLRVVVLFACVYALSSADTGAVGALAPQLETSLRASNAQIGLIAAVAAFAGAAATIPVGILTDRVNRVNLLAGSIVLWSLAMLAGALAPSFLVLLLTRVGLGAVNASSGPTVLSLTGDLFPAAERARMLGLILTGELLGAGIGVVVSGDLGSISSWRVGFAWLTIPGLALALAIRALLVEPARGGQSRLEPGARELVGRGRRRRRGRARRSDRAARDAEQETVQELAREQHVTPHRELVLHRDPATMPVWRAVRYVLRVRTNVILIVASALAYVFYAGIQTFAVVLMRSRYHLGEAEATSLLILIGCGGLAGTVVSGHVADRLLSRGRLNARVLVAAIGYLAAALIFLPALLSPVLAISLPLFALGAGALTAVDPPMNAARLDIIHPGLWGRAEGVRTVLYMLSFAISPIVFGVLSDALGSRGLRAAAITGGSANGAAMAETFLIMLAAIAIAGLAMLWALRSYPHDVRTASASIEATSGSDGDDPASA